MDEMRPVSRTVATVALLLLILPHALRTEDESLEHQIIDRNIEISMQHMANNMEKGHGVSQHETNLISRAFRKLNEYLQKKHGHPGGGNSVGTHFEYSNKKRKSHRTLNKDKEESFAGNL